MKTGGVPLNCAFSGSDLFITDFGTYETGDALARMVGSLMRVPVDAAGATPFRGSINRTTS